MLFLLIFTGYLEGFLMNRLTSFISRYRKVAVIGLLVLILTGTGLYFFYPRQKTINYYTDSDSIEFHDGDLILRRGKSFVSQLVLLGDKDSEYSHIGIVSLRNDTPYVIHAVPGEVEQGMPEYVKMETVPEFLAIDKSADFAVYSLRSTYQEAGETAADKAMEFFREHIIFDSKFDHTDNSKLYCTELVWCAYKAAGIELVKNYDRINVAVYDSDFIKPSSIFLNPVFKKTYPN